MREPTPVDVRATGVGKTYDDRAVLGDVTFTLEPGTVTALLGHNGAGKSTLVRRLAGLVRGPGEVLFAGLPLEAHDAPHRVLGVDLGTPQVHPGRTVAAHLRLLARDLPEPRRRVAEVVELLGIQRLLPARPGGFSTGMKRSVAIASALVAEPSVLVLDEPINGLEVAAVRGVKALVRDHADRGGTVLIASHVLAEAERVADRVLVLDAGRVVVHEDLAAYLARRPVDDVEVWTDDVERLTAALVGRGYRVTAEGPGAVVVAGAAARDVALCARDAEVLVSELRTRRSSLEDVFLARTGFEEHDDDERAGTVRTGGAR